MTKFLSVLFVYFFAWSLAHAQSLQEMQKYDTVSPLKTESLKTGQTVDPEQSYKTPEEEQLAEIKEKEEADKKALEEKIYLDTDYHFFQSLNVTLDEDELDKAYKQAETTQNISDLKNNDQTVKSEVKATTPQLLSQTEAVAADTRREMILKKIAANAKMVRTCILQNKKEDFKGTAMTLAWEVEASGKVANAQVKATDVENKEIQNCIVKGLAGWDFSDVVKDLGKSSQIEYTYRFVNSKNSDVATK
jgi:hypothetical protein